MYSLEGMVWVVGLEPTRDCSQQILSPCCLPIPTYPHMARLEGLEPSTYGVEIRYSILIELQPHILVLAAGLEPARHGDTRFLVLRVCQFHHASISILQDLYRNNLQSVFTVSPIKRKDLTTTHNNAYRKENFYEK